MTITVFILIEARRASAGISPSEMVLISGENNYCDRNTTYPLYFTSCHCYMTYWSKSVQNATYCKVKQFQWFCHGHTAVKNGGVLLLGAVLLIGSTRYSVLQKVDVQFMLNELCTTQLTHNVIYNVASKGHLSCGNVVSYTTFTQCCINAVIAHLTHNITTTLHLSLV